MRLYLTPVSKNKLRLSDNKEYRATGLTGRTRQTCPKRRSTETTSVAISNSPCRFQLMSLPIADMAFANVRILRQYHHALASSSPLSYIDSHPLSIRYGTFAIACLKSRGNAKEYSGRPGLGCASCVRLSDAISLLRPCAVDTVLAKSFQANIVGRRAGNRWKQLFFNNVELNCCQ